MPSFLDPTDKPFGHLVPMDSLQCNIRLSTSQTSLADAFLLTSSADKTRLGYVGRQPGTSPRTSDEWYTPQSFIEKARGVMGSIDLDPFSSAQANETVRAAYYFDRATSALTRAWRNPQQKRQYPAGVNVWMNPPYGTPLLSQAIEAFVGALTHGHIAQAIVIVNNATETRWFQLLCEVSRVLCFPRQRIAFETPDGKAQGGNTRGQVFFYAATTSTRIPHFVDTFCQIGYVASLGERRP